MLEKITLRMLTRLAVALSVGSVLDAYENHKANALQISVPSVLNPDLSLEGIEFESGRDAHGTRLMRHDKPVEADDQEGEIDVSEAVLANGEVQHEHRASQVLTPREQNPELLGTLLGHNILPKRVNVDFHGDLVQDPKIPNMLRSNMSALHTSLAEEHLVKVIRTNAELGHERAEVSDTLTIIYAVTLTCIAVLMVLAVTSCVRLIRETHRDEAAVGASLIGKPKPTACAGVPLTSLKSKTGEMMSFRDVYEIGTKLGDGNFGVVYSVTKRDTRKDFAVKMIDLGQCDTEDVLLEIEMLRRVRHETLVAGCEEVFMDACFCYVVMPKYSGGDLIDSLCLYLDTYMEQLPEFVFLNLFTQMTAAIVYIHERRVVHRDVKPDNYLTSKKDLVAPDNRVVLADFGLAEVVDEEDGYLDDVCGTPMFYSPEMLTDDPKFGFPCDIWALGITGCVLIGGESVFESVAEVKQWIESGDPPPIPKRASKHTTKFLLNALDKDQHTRATGAETLAAIRSHPDLAAVKKSKSASIRENRLSRASMVLVDEVRLQRREQMVHVLNNDFEKGTRRPSTVTLSTFDSTQLNASSGGSSRSSGALRERVAAKTKMFQGENFKFADDQQITHHFEWWELGRCVEENLLPNEFATDRLERGAEYKIDYQLSERPNLVRPEDTTSLREILLNYRVDMDLWGSDDHLNNLVRECRFGQSVLAVEERKLIRVVDVVVPVLTSESGMVLVWRVEGPGQAAEQTILPGIKRLACEHTNAAALRALAALNIKECDVVFTPERPVLIHKKQSTKYIGIDTIYRRHVINIDLNMDRLSQDRLTFPGWPDGEPLVKESAKGRTTWTWLTHVQCEEQDLINFGDATQAPRYCALVPARRKAASPGEIQKLIKAHGISPLDEKVLAKLVEEEQRGLSALDEQAHSDTSHSLARVVKQTVIVVVNEKGLILVEAGKESNGKMKGRKSLPMVRQMFFENPFLAAKRQLSVKFSIEDDEMYFDTHTGGSMVTPMTEQQTPGIRSLQANDFIQVKLDLDQTLIHAHGEDSQDDDDD